MPKGSLGSTPSCRVECKCRGSLKGNLSHDHNCNKIRGLDISCASIWDARHISQYSQVR